VENAEQILPTELELRTHGAWRFLSLQSAAPFFREMWVPINNPEEFQANLRACMIDLHAESIYYLFPGRLNALIHFRVVSKLPEADQVLLALWIRAVYIGDGPDRLGETLWNSLIPRLASQSESPLGTVQATLSSHQSRKLEIRARLKEKLEAQIPAGISEWDQHQVGPDGSGLEEIQTTIHLICSYNAFVACWERYCSGLSFDQLHLIHKLGAEVAKARNMMDSGLPFPCSWRFEMLPFLNRFESTEGSFKLNGT
jgi:hypothetical protein